MSIISSSKNRDLHQRSVWPLQKTYPSNSFEEENNESESDSEDETSLFSIEIVNGEPVCVCNLCDEGLEKEEDLIVHMKEIHNRVLHETEVIDSCMNNNCDKCRECILRRWDY